jgi:NAD(P)-dependent dehydrogenase (short-subunit alcohol dehydrogenase family)
MPSGGRGGAWYLTDNPARVAVVTGASSGMGRAVAVELASSGCAVALCANDPAGLSSAADEIASRGGVASALNVDVTDQGALSAAIDGVAREWGRVDHLVTAAGIMRYGTVVDTTDQLWDEVLRVNVGGVFGAVRSCVRHMRQQGSGSIVVVSSVQALAAQTSVVAYSASKGALNAFVRAVAVDEASYGIRINCLCPGSVDTPMLRASAEMFAGAGQAIEDVLHTWGGSHPLGRVGRPEEIAAVAAFLLSDKASFVTGAELTVDGGLLAQLAVALPTLAG